MSSEVDVQVREYSCACANRSLVFPPMLTCLVKGDSFSETASFHWDDRVGWVPCDAAEDEYRRLCDLLSLEYTPIETYRAAIVAAAARFNLKPLEHWRSMYLVELGRHIARGVDRVARAESVLERRQADLRLLECRRSVAELVDLEMAEAAYRILNEGWVGSPEDLLASVKAVLS
jgi:hypothetical protein